MDVSAIRRHNLRLVAARHESLNEFANVLDIDAGLLSKLIGANPSKPIGNRLADRLERALALPPGALSSLAFGIDHSGQPVEECLLTASPVVRALVVHILTNQPDDDTARAFLQIFRRLT